MAIKDPPFSVDDQEYYPLHEEDDVPETAEHEAAVRYARNAMAARFPDWLVTGNVCIYWERGNTRDYRAPDLFVVKAPLTEPVTRVYQLWKQPPVAFALEVGSRTTFRTDVGPKVELYQEKVKAAEYGHVDLDRGEQRLWRLQAGSYVVVAPEPNGRLRSAELGLEFGLDEAGLLRFYTPGGEMLLTHAEEVRLRKEEARRRQEAEHQREEEARRRQEAEHQREEEARRRQEAEHQREEEERRRLQAEERTAELERQLAALQARLADDESGGNR